MGVLIKIDGVTFDPKHVIDTVDLPDPDCEHEYDNACDAECNLCGATRAVTHNYVDGFCTICGKKDPNKVWTIDDYPVQDTLKGLYDLGLYDGLGNDNDSLVNHAPEPHINTAAEAFDGSCTVKDDYITFSGATNTNRMHTYLRLPFDGKLSAVVLFRVQSGNRMLIGNRTAGGSGKGSGVNLRNDGVEFGSGGTHITEAFSAINSDNFAILAMTVDESGILRVVRYTNGALSDLYTSAGSVDEWSNDTSAGNAVQIGGYGVSGNANGDADISLAAIHTGKLDDEQLESICEFVKTYGEQKGLTIE